jgi:hypothetical protein
MNPILDQPQTIDTDQLLSTASYRLANQDIAFHADARTDLTDLVWPWADDIYARRIQLRILTLRDEAIIPLVTRFYPGYQEEILGNERMIVSKRLAALLNSSYDRAVLWTLECQAEGDHVLRLEIDIDWGQPLIQRMVDGLLVAQRNPQPAQGIYSQSNADSTCIFGNPYGRADFVDIEHPQQARLVYHVLVNGVVEVPLLLTLSDVGEQVAWNGFLALRDTERAFELSVKAWDQLLKAGRLWTPDANLNQAIQAGRATAARHIQRLRSGYAPSDRDMRHLPALAHCLDAFDIRQSRNLLAHARRVAERSNGRIPRRLPVRPNDGLVDPGPALIETNAAYLSALYEHMRHHFDSELLAEHYAAVRACAEALIQHRWQAITDDDGPTLAAAGAALRRALGLALQQLDSVNSVRWESEACEMERRAQALDFEEQDEVFAPADLLAQGGWQTPTDQPWHFADPWLGIELAGQAVWRGCGITVEQDHVRVEPSWPAGWQWWALIDLPIGNSKLSLLWDGATLHATQPVHSPLPLQTHSRINVLRAEEHDFDLQFEMKSEQDSVAEGQVFKPQFMESVKRQT